MFVKLDHLFDYTVPPTSVCKTHLRNFPNELPVAKCYKWLIVELVT